MGTKKRIPWNKGKKGLQIAWNKGKKGATNSGSFKKGHIQSEASRKKMSLAKKGKPSNMKGRKHKSESLQKMSVTWFVKGQTGWNKGKKGVMPEPWNKGKKMSEEVLANMQKAGKLFKKGQTPWNKGKTGIYSEETIKKIRIGRAKNPPHIRTDTKPEKILQKLCKDIGIKFQTQRDFNLGFQNHAVDLFIEPNICIEVDGDYPHANPQPYHISGRSTIQPGHKPNQIIFRSSQITKTAKWTWENDRKITQALIQHGNKVLRFWQSELEQNPEKCLQKIIKIIKESKR